LTFWWRIAVSEYLKFWFAQHLADVAIVGVFIVVCAVYAGIKWVATSVRKRDRWGDE
jgi:hypothetical protein